MFHTADLCDNHGNLLQVAAPIFTNYGRRQRFFGPISTVKVFEDFEKVVEALETAEGGSVVVIDGGGSVNRALLGDRLARIMLNRRLAGVIINGAVRDKATLANLDVAVLALGTCPMRGEQEGTGELGGTVEFASVIWKPGHFVYGDDDGIVISDMPIH